MHYVADGVYEVSSCTPDQFRDARTYQVNTFIAIGKADDVEEHEAKQSGLAYFRAIDLKEAVSSLMSRVAKPVLLRCDRCGTVLLAYYRVRGKSWPALWAARHLSPSQLKELKNLLKE